MSNETIYEVLNVAIKGKKYIVTFTNLDEDVILLEDQIVSYRIIKGNAFTGSEIKQIKKSADIANFYTKAIHYIDFKPRTEYEVSIYLKKAELSEYDIECIIKKLKAIGYINDERFATRFTEELIRKQKGRYGIKQILLQKGIDKEQVEVCLQSYAEEVEERNALAIAQQVVKHLKSYPEKKQKLQMIQKLNTQGYSQDMIQYALNHIVIEADFEERLVKEYQKLLDKNCEKDKIISKLMAKGYAYSSIKEMMKSS